MIEHNSNWLIPSSDENSIRAETIIHGCVDRDGKLLFIFPTRVSLTTITLHYHCDSDNFQHLPRLRFYAILDDFDVWDALTTSTPYVDVASVPPGGKPAGRRNVSIIVNFNTRKMLMYKFNSNFVFSASEFQFFNCNSKQLACMYMYYQALRLAIFPLQQ